MSDPVEEFRKLADVVAEMRREVKEGLERTAPDYGRDLARILTALQEIEKKPALRMTAAGLEGAAERGAEKGTKEAAGAFRDGVQALENAQERADRRMDRFQWLWAGLVLVTLCAGIGFGALLGFRFVPVNIITSPAGCAFIGGTFAPAQPPGRSQKACIFLEYKAN